MIQREIEKAGIPTIGISIAREYTEKMKPPRTLFLDWPWGHPLGTPFYREQQVAVLLNALEQLYAISVPGTIYDVGFKWDKKDYPNVLW
ncbi:MAG: hypothetical protein H8E81_04330 [Deltaproteobacteria bacterium]|nr:hypothetical protein [Deltaproteobacteria bacterium]